MKCDGDARDRDLRARFGESIDPKILLSARIEYVHIEHTLTYNI